MPSRKGSNKKADSLELKRAKGQPAEKADSLELKRKKSFPKACQIPVTVEPEPEAPTRLERPRLEPPHAALVRISGISSWSPEEYSVGDEILSLRSNGSWSPGTITEIGDKAVKVELEGKNFKQIRKEKMSALLKKQYLSQTLREALKMGPAIEVVAKKNAAPQVEKACLVRESNDEKTIQVSTPRVATNDETEVTSQPILLGRVPSEAQLAKKEVAPAFMKGKSMVAAVAKVEKPAPSIFLMLVCPAHWPALLPKIAELLLNFRLDGKVRNKTLAALLVLITSRLASGRGFLRRAIKA